MYGSYLDMTRGTPRPVREIGGGVRGLAGGGAVKRQVREGGKCRKNGAALLLLRSALNVVGVNW